MADGYATEKVQFVTLRDSAPFNLTILAAQERGFWKEQGVEVEWIAMRSAADTLKAVAAGTVSIGGAGAASLLPAIARGVPAVIVSTLRTRTDFAVYVRPDSPYKDPRELKGARIGVSGLGATAHVYARLLTRAVGIEKDVRFVGAGGITGAIAALKAKAIDASVQNSYNMMRLILAGEVKELAAAADYLPKEWVDLTFFARKEIIRDRPEVVRRVVKGTAKAADFVMTNRSWSVEKLKEIQGFSEEAARLIYERLDLSRTGKIERKAIENLRNVIIEYEIVPKGTPVPPVDELFTTKFTD